MRANGFFSCYMKRKNNITRIFRGHTFQIDFSSMEVWKLLQIWRTHLKRKIPSRNKTGAGVKLFETRLKREKCRIADYNDLCKKGSEQKILSPRRDLMLNSNCELPRPYGRASPRELAPRSPSDKESRGVEVLPPRAFWRRNRNKYSSSKNSYWNPLIAEGLKKIKEVFKK